MYTKYRMCVQVGQQLLKLNILKDRVTFIPLNKINPFVLHQAKLDAAKKVDGKGRGEVEGGGGGQKTDLKFILQFSVRELTLYSSFTAVIQYYEKFGEFHKTYFI